MPTPEPQRTTQPTTQRAPTSGEREQPGASPLQAQLRGASFAEGEALLSPVQRQRDGGAAADGGSVDERMPSQVSLEGLSVGFTLPAGKTLAGAWSHDVRTSSPTRINLSVSRDGVSVQMSPGIYIDAQWPAQNMRVSGAGRSFGPARTWANVHVVRGMGEGFIDLTGRASDEVTKLIDGAIAGTAMAEPGYDPFSDDRILSTLGAIKANFESLPAAAGGGGDAVDAAELTRPTLSATLAMTAAFEQQANGAGVRVPAGGRFSAEVVGDGNLGALLSARGPGEAAQAVPISAIHLRSDAIELTKGGDPVARLDHIQVARGGQVTLSRFTLLGSGRTAAGFETLVRLLVGAAQAVDRGAPPQLGVAAAAQRGDLEPRFVQGLSRSMIEEGLTTAVRQLVTDNRAAIPGVDLATALGV